MKRRLGRWTLARRATAATFLTVLILGSRDWFPWLKGSTTATESFGVLPLTDPLAAVEIALATRELPLLVVVGALLLLGFAAFAGPVFCGWVCPLGLVLDLNDALRRRLQSALRRRKRALPEWRLSRELRYAVLGLTLGVAVFARVPIFVAVSPINTLTSSAIFGLQAGLLVVIGLALIEWLAPRVWCRSLCPLGAVYATVGQRARLRVQINPTTAGQTPCRMCTLHCPLGIRVMEDHALRGRAAVDHPDCTRCGSCIDACPRGVLALGLRPRETHISPDPKTGKPLKEAAADAVADL